ncbi:MAG TPA: hypothetical protein VLD61_11655 [Methylomirabilota bacterium]|nr:hypothetical protein [Methylomirabilota bacterium]
MTAGLRLETRADGSILVTRRGPGRWGAAVVGVAAGAFLLAAATGGRMSLLGLAVVAPLAVAAFLAALAAVRHRDWLLFDRPARQIVFREGLGSIFRAASVVPFTEVEAILSGVEEDPPLVGLLRTGDLAWPLGVPADRAEGERLVAALRAVGGWRVVRG